MAKSELTSDLQVPAFPACVVASATPPTLTVHTVIGGGEGADGSLGPSFWSIVFTVLNDPQVAGQVPSWLRKDSCQKPAFSGDPAAGTESPLCPWFLGFSAGLEVAMDMWLPPSPPLSALPETGGHQGSASGLRLCCSVWLLLQALLPT